MARTTFVGMFMFLAVAGGTTFGADPYRFNGTTSAAKFVTQSDPTAGALTIGLVDSLNQRAIVFDNTSPPSNPTGLGPVTAGAAAALTLSASTLTVDVTNMDTTGFLLGYGNTSTDYTAFSSLFGFFIQDGTNLYFSDSTKNTDKLNHLLVTPQGSGLTLTYSRAGNGSFGDGNITFTNIVAVPEPASALVIAFGAAGLLLRRHRKLVSPA